MPRGGAREGKPGKSYGNRTDLNEAAPSRFYGDRANQERQMAAVPIQPPPRPEVAPAPQMRVPPPFDRPTERPDEPVQAGLSTGPGPGPSSIAAAAGDQILGTLRVLYERFPHPDLLDMIQYEEGRLQ